MYRLAFALIATLPLAAGAAECRVSGTTYDLSGKPARGVVRLLDLDSGRTAFAATDAQATFTIDGSGGSRYRLDLISAPTRVTGSHIPTRSVIGQSATFGCPAGEHARQDVRAEVD